jgi:hypothetical protein
VANVDITLPFSMYHDDFFSLPNFSDDIPDFSPQKEYCFISVMINFLNANNAVYPNLIAPDISTDSVPKFKFIKNITHYHGYNYTEEIRFPGYDYILDVEQIIDQDIDNLSRQFIDNGLPEICTLVSGWVDMYITKCYTVEMDFLNCIFKNINSVENILFYAGANHTNLMYNFLIYCGAIGIRESNLLITKYTIKEIQNILNEHVNNENKKINCNFVQYSQTDLDTINKQRIARSYPTKNL